MTQSRGLGYYLDLLDGRVLYLGGQYLHTVAEAHRFPAIQFEIVEVASSGALLGITPTGSFMAPSSTRQPFTAREWDAGLVPEDRTFVARAFEDLRVVVA